jgi:general secretion pathway protein A
MATDLGVDGKRSLTQQRDELERWLVDRYEDGKNVVIFVDEAQVLDNAQLELVRALLNFETHQHKLIQIVLAGQLELREKLQSEKNRALYSRVSTYSVLDPLTLEETGGMLAHRCDKEGIKNPFTPAAVEKLYVVTKGIPRSILKVAALAYEMMLMENLRTIDPELVSDTVPEVAIHE